MRTSILLGTVFMLVIGTMMLTGCGPSGGSDKEDLVGQVWTLTALVGQAPLPVTEITAQFDADGKVNGSAGCNSYSGTYEVDGNKLSFSQPMAMTMMACAPVVMAQEVAYMKVLESVETYEIEDGALTMYDGDKNAAAEFEVVKQGLEGTSWEVTSYNTGTGAVTSVIIGTEITAEFGEDGAPSEGGASNGDLTGSAGCNNYVAEYKTEGNKIEISSAVATTRKACQEEGVMKQENAYLAALETADTYKITGMDMEMRTSEGSKVAGFKRAPGQ